MRTGQRRCSYRHICASGSVAPRTALLRSALIGFEGRFDYAAIGTVSNVASRLCDEAKPGQILISPRVLTKVEHAVKVEQVGEFALKGNSSSFGGLKRRFSQTQTEADRKCPGVSLNSLLTSTNTWAGTPIAAGNDRGRLQFGCLPMAACHAPSDRLLPIARPPLDRRIAVRDAVPSSFPRHLVRLHVLHPHVVAVLSAIRCYRLGSGLARLLRPCRIAAEDVSSLFAEFGRREPKRQSGPVER
jgi:Adenylate and Guanylate cyclase catalytic domain